MFEITLLQHLIKKNYVTKTTHLDDIFNSHIICWSKVTSNMFEIILLQHII